MKRIRTLTSYAAHARFLAQCDSDIRWMNRRHMPVRTPYSSGPIVCVYTSEQDHNNFVIIAETSHRRYEVWLVPSGVVFKTEFETDNDKAENLIPT